MCGRFCIAASPGELSERYNVTVPPGYHPRYNLSPGQEILTITKTASSFGAHLTEWGFQYGSMHRVINARLETIHQKPLFRDLFSHNRCLIPASGYYEWKHDGHRKIPYYFSSQSDHQISFAGLIRPSHEREQVVILTTRAIPPYSDIHERMPVILNKLDEQVFLSDGSISLHNGIEMYEVSPRVNTPMTDDPDLIKPWKSGPAQKTLPIDP